MRVMIRWCVEGAHRYRFYSRVAIDNTLRYLCHFDHDVSLSRRGVTISASVKRNAQFSARNALCCFKQVASVKVGGTTVEGQ